MFYQSVIYCHKGRGNQGKNMVTLLLKRCFDMNFWKNTACLRPPSWVKKNRIKAAAGKALWKGIPAEAIRCTPAANRRPVRRVFYKNWIAAERKPHKTYGIYCKTMPCRHHFAAAVYKSNGKENNLSLWSGKTGKIKDDKTATPGKNWHQNSKGKKPGSEKQNRDKTVRI